MVPASSTTPSQMFPERTVINTSGKFITAIIFHSLLFYSYPSSWNYTGFLSSKSKVRGRHQVVIHPRRKDLCGKPIPLHQKPQANLEDQQVQPNIVFWPLHRNLWTRSQADPVSTLMGGQGENWSCFFHPVPLSVTPTCLTVTHLIVMFIHTLPKCIPQNPRSRGGHQMGNKYLCNN